MCAMSGIWLHTTAQIKFLRVLEGLMNGGASPVIVPALEAAFAPWAGGVIPANPYAGGAISIATSADAALRSSGIFAHVTTGAALVGGERFSITHATLGKRFYTVVAAGAPSSGTQLLAISPPLREATLSGAAMDFETPGCVMRLMNPEETFDSLNQTRTANVTLQFQESFDVT